jgi:hypothetical protein
MNIEESWALVEAVERTGLTYMMSENFVFTRQNMMLLNMTNANVFGELTFAEGGYIHDSKHLMFNPDGSLTWRGVNTRNENSYAYPTHSLGPIAQWLKINREGGDEFESIATFESRELATHLYAAEQYGEEYEGAKEGYWKRSDCLLTIIRTKKNVLIQLRHDAKSARPHQMYHYGLQGANGAFMAGRHSEEDPIVWIKGRSPGKSPYKSGSPDKATWEPLWNYSDEFEHPLWKEWGSIASKTGHNGGDFFVMNEFSSAILEKRRPLIDVYDAVTWSSVRPLSAQSLLKQNQPVPFVRFRKPSLV